MSKSHPSHWPSWKEIDWPSTLFICSMPIVGTLGTVFAIYSEGFSWGMLFFSLIFAALTNLSITTGYHRLFSHRSYEAHPLARLILIFIGTSAWQSSILKWCTDHRVHHSEVDTDEDPYSINKGFWYAHLGWMFWKDPADFQIGCPDLQKDALIRFQHKHYYTLAILIGFILPAAIGWAFGYPLTGLFMGGALRIALTQQSTFCVNSLSHTMGKQTYSQEISARDSLFVSILTHGEGYHNFHHKFQFDYRNAIHWWQWDPTKWTIQLMKYTGLAKKLKTVSQTEILKARLQAESLKLQSKGYSQEKLEALHNQVLQTQIKLKKLKEDYYLRKAELKNQSQEKLDTLRAEIKLAQLEFQYALREWKTRLNAPLMIS